MPAGASTSRTDELTPLELLARALLLVEVPLVQVASGPAGDQRGIAMQMLAHGAPDEAANRRAAASLPRAPSLMHDLVQPLCRAIYRMRSGVPSLRSEALATHHNGYHRLLRVVCPDALASMHPHLAPAPGDRWNGPAVPPLADSAIHPLLEEGTCDSHVHLGGVLPSAYYWITLVGGSLTFDALGSFSSPDRGHAGSESWMLAVSAAAVLRLRMAREVERRADRLPRGLLCVDEACFPGLPRLKHRAWRALDDFELRPDFRSGARPGRCPTLPSPQVRREWVSAMSADLRYVRERRPSELPAFVDVLRDGWAVEYADRRAAFATHYLAGERRLLAAVAGLLCSGDTRDLGELECDTLRYLRIRNAFHQLVVHERGSHGLLRFLECFGRRWLRGPRHQRTRALRHRRNRRQFFALERARMAAALQSQLVEPFGADPPGGLAAPTRRIELRVSPTPGVLLLRTMYWWLRGINDYLDTASRRGGDLRPETVPPHQIGFIFHFLKRGKTGRDEEYSGLQARALAHALREHPGLRRVVVGVDAAGDERRATPRTFTAAFACLQRFADHHREIPGETPVRLGWTFHVGEDSWDLATGLRHIDETVQLLFAGRPGRLGHALALAEDPEHFYHRRGGSVELARGEHLLDLLWAYRELSGHRADARAQYVLHRISAQCPSGSPDHAAVYECARQLMERRDEHHLSTIARYAPCRDSPRRCFSEIELLGKLGVHADLERTIHVHADEHWLGFVKHLQSSLRQRLARVPVVIESNPTSNLHLGGFHSYLELPYAAFIDAGFPVTINTDDPGIFMTSLPLELASLYHCRVPVVGHRQALLWLAERLADARRGTFLSPIVPVGAAALDVTSEAGLNRLFARNDRRSHPLRR